MEFQNAIRPLCSIQVDGAEVMPDMTKVTINGEIAYRFGGMNGKYKHAGTFLVFTEEGEPDVMLFASMDGKTWVLCLGAEIDGHRYSGDEMLEMLGVNMEEEKKIREKRMERFRRQYGI